VLNAQTLGVALAAFGLTGSALDRWTTLDGAPLVGVALAAAAAAGALSVWLLAGWAVPSARVDVEDERYVMQGHPATVTRAIGDDDAGEIAYEADGRRWTVRARSWDGAPLAAGTEVAIERVEDGVAYVEEWAAVETRL
jgi:membrane protein implicated in regulation of membrane protease activity